MYINGDLGGDIGWILIPGLGWELGKANKK
jgi:hypothetical protein